MRNRLTLLLAPRPAASCFFLPKRWTLLSHLVLAGAWHFTDRRLDRGARRARQSHSAPLISGRDALDSGIRRALRMSGL